MQPTFQKGDALLIVDVQRDFLAGGVLPVPQGDELIPVMNRYISLAEASDIPVFASRDWHPPDHCSFRSRGGIWPPRCVPGSERACFAPELQLPTGAIVVSKATETHADTYSTYAYALEAPFIPLAHASELPGQCCDGQWP